MNNKASNPTSNTPTALASWMRGLARELEHQGCDARALFNEAGLDFACQVLRPGGHFVAKVLAGGADNDLVAALKRNFTSVKHAKPPASRKGSSEWYVIASGFKGRAEEAVSAS